MSDEDSAAMKAATSVPIGVMTQEDLCNAIGRVIDANLMRLTGASVPSEAPAFVLVLWGDGAPQVNFSTNRTQVKAAEACAAVVKHVADTGSALKVMPH